MENQGKPALTAKQMQALELIVEKGPIKSAVLARQINIDASTFRTLYLPFLRTFGVKNNGSGYYVDDEP
jgi:hypothetical protein